MIRTRLACLVLLILGPALSGHQAKAEDDADAVLLSGLRAVPAGSVEVASSAISLRHGKIELRLTTRAADTAATIDLQGPEFSWLGEQDPYPDRQFPELQIFIDHDPAIKHEISAASFAGADITAELQAANIDPFTISQSPPVLFPAAPNAASFNRLLMQGAIRKLGGQDVAAWSARRKLDFGLEKGSHSITLDYNARPAVTLQPAATLRKILPLASYCLSAPALRRAAARAAKSGYVLAVQYAIPAGINGNTGGPVAVELAAPGSAGLPAAIAFFCAPSGQAVTAANGAIDAPAKPDASGIVHILTLGSAARD
jgi:hypothetical protein